MLSTLQILNLVNISSLLKKGPSFVPTPKDVNWFNLCQDFDKFTNQLRMEFNQVIDKSTVKKQTSTPILAVITSRIIPMNKNQKRNTSNNLYGSKETKNEDLETFVDTIEK